MTSLGSQWTSQMKLHGFRRLQIVLHIVVELHSLTTLLGRNHVAGRYYKGHIDRKTWS